MDGLITFLRSRTTLRNAIVILALFGLNSLLLGLLDQPLMERAAGEPKLDLRFGYNLATVHRLLHAYGEDGRRMYVWNLLVDTPFPILGSFGVGLLALVAFSDPRWQRISLMSPLRGAGG